MGNRLTLNWIEARTNSKITESQLKKLADENAKK